MTKTLVLHELWVWLWFAVGSLSSIMLRAWYKVQGPDHTTATYGAYFAQFGIPIGFRFLIGAGLYWLTFYPKVLADLIALVGWNVTIPAMFPSLAVVALFVGAGMDRILDWLASKVGVGDVLPKFMGGK